jgi:hypothetical protein
VILKFVGGATVFDDDEEEDDGPEGELPQPARASAAATTGMNPRRKTRRRIAGEFIVTSRRA